jgi:hypothetical protein
LILGFRHQALHLADLLLVFADVAGGAIAFGEQGVAPGLALLEAGTELAEPLLPLLESQAAGADPLGDLLQPLPRSL